MNGAKQKSTQSGPRNIVIFSDGTGNSANKDRGTNVFKLYEALDLQGHLRDKTLTEQIAFYDDGVGTESWKPLRMLGGAFGWGLSRNVKQLYTDVVRIYKPGDRIFLFGFSRGAFTVRTLAGFITSCGILDYKRYDTERELTAAVEAAYEVYRKKYMTGAHRDLLALRDKLQRKDKLLKTPSPFEMRVAAFRRTEEVLPGKVAFIGAWDTVDAVGMPFAGLAGFINYFIYPFKFADHGLDKNIDFARHALSIDDERFTFHPLMWDEKPGDAKRIRQVWFAGVHSNVGGGYPKQGMSLVALAWMMAEAKPCGLRAIVSDREFYDEHQNVNDKLYNSRAGVAVYYRYKPRDIHAMCAKANIQPVIHESAIDRVAKRTEGYAPGNLPNGLKIEATGGRPTRFPDAAAVIERAYGSDTSLLDRVKPWVWVRRAAHFFYVLATVLALWLALKEQAAEIGWWDALTKLFSGDVFSVVWSALTSNVYFDVTLAAVGIFFAVGLMAERCMRDVFSAFWHEVGPKL